MHPQPDRPKPSSARSLSPMCISTTPSQHKSLTVSSRVSSNLAGGHVLPKDNCAIRLSLPSYRQHRQPRGASRMPNGMSRRSARLQAHHAVIRTRTVSLATKIFICGTLQLLPRASRVKRQRTEHEVEPAFMMRPSVGIDRAKAVSEHTCTRLPIKLILAE